MCEKKSLLPAGKTSQFVMDKLCTCGYYINQHLKPRFFGKTLWWPSSLRCPQCDKLWMYNECSLHLLSSNIKLVKQGEEEGWLKPKRVKLFLQAEHKPKKEKPKESTKKLKEQTEEEKAYKVPEKLGPPKPSEAYLKGWKGGLKIGMLPPEVKKKRKFAGKKRGDETKNLF